MSVEKTYQTNITNLLSEIEKQIRIDEESFQYQSKFVENSYSYGFFAGRLNALNAMFCTLRDLKTKSFHEIEFPSDEISSMIKVPKKEAYLSALAQFSESDLDDAYEYLIEKKNLNK